MRHTVKQPSLFDRPVSPARAAGERAAQACADRAVRTTWFDLELARALVLRRLLQSGPTCGEDLVNECKLAGLVPHDDRAFGAVFAQLSRRKQIRCRGLTMRSKGHGTAGGRIWEAC